MNLLYEVCPICRGEPERSLQQQGCPVCKLVRVVEVGLTTEQVDCMRQRLEDASLLIQAVLAERATLHQSSYTDVVVTLHRMTIDDSGRKKSIDHHVPIGADGLVKRFDKTLRDRLKGAST